MDSTITNYEKKLVISSLETFINHPKTQLFLDKENRKVVHSSKEISNDAEIFLKHLVMVNEDLITLEFEGWKVVSGKYNILPLSYCGFIGEKVSLLFNGKYAVVLETPDEFLEYISEIGDKSLDQLILSKGVEVVGELKGDRVDYRGCIMDFEAKIISEISDVNNRLTVLITDVLNTLIPFNWQPNLAWFAVGKDYSFISVNLNKKIWLIKETENLVNKLYQF